MKGYIKLCVVLAAMFLNFSCIKNDIPYPVIKGDVLSFSVRGQVGEAVINTQEHTITVELSDTINLKTVQVTGLKIVEQSTAKIDSGMVLNLATPYEFEVTTYQVYRWTLRAKQNIERYVKVENQIGDAKIDVLNRKVIVNVAAEQDVYAIKVLDFKLGPSIATVMPNPMNVVNFASPVVFLVSFFDEVQEWTVYVFPTNEIVSTGAVWPWAKIAYLEGNIKSGSKDIAGFQIRNKGTETWADVADVKVNGGKISAKAKGLTPATAYEFRAVLGTEVGEPVSFTTEEATSIPNLSMDDAYKDGKTWYMNASGGNSFWATGNAGLTSVNKESNTVQVSGADAYKGNAVRMTSQGGIPLVKHAAGNLFAGDFVMDVGTPKNSPKFGRPYTARPLGLKGWYKYKSTPITVNAGNPGSGDDMCHIYISLEDWGGVTARPLNPTVIGYGEFKSAENVTQYSQFSFEIKYNSTTAKPTHIVLTATSSVYGGDFCGGAGSELSVDEFELLWE